MAFGFTSGNANNIANFFALLEAFLVARGWILVAGGGTTDIVYRSTGETGAFTKLYIRVWRDAAVTHRVNFRVQDDAAGTHNTQDATYGFMTAIGGDKPFAYWICGDLDCVFITIKGATGYSGAWMGYMIPYCFTQTDETHYMGSFNPEFTYSAPPLQYIFGKILQSQTATFNQLMYVDTTIYATGVVNPIDGGITIPASKAYMNDSQVHGMPKFFAGPLRDFPAGNPEDTYDSGEPASIREWLILGSGETRWCMMRVGPQPTNTRGTTADYFTARGNAANWNQVFNIIIEAAQAAGWTVDLHPSGGWRFFSAGELGTESIYCWLTLSVNKLYTRVQDDAGGTHYAGSEYTYSTFPYDVFAGADKDCILFSLDVGAGAINIHWMGRALTSYLDESAVGDEYKLVAGHTDNSFRCLRRPDGSWNQGAWWTETNPGFRYRSRSPQTYDATYIGHWPICYWSTTKDLVWALKHLIYIYPSGVTLYNYDLFQMDNGDLAFYRTGNRGHRAA
jgi:hypothetical protein